MRLAIQGWDISNQRISWLASRSPMEAVGARVHKEKNS
jgi:hypothetical protein